MDMVPLEELMKISEMELVSRIRRNNHVVSERIEIDELKNIVKIFARERKERPVVIIDGLEKSKNENSSFEHAVIELSEIARDFFAPVLVAADLVERDYFQWPIRDVDLFENGDVVENMASWAGILTPDMDDSGRFENGVLKVLKGREGKGKHRMGFNWKTMTFEDSVG